MNIDNLEKVQPANVETSPKSAENEISTEELARQAVNRETENAKIQAAMAAEQQVPEKINQAREEIQNLSAAENKMDAEKVEALPQTPAEQRLFENLGYNQETLAQAKEEFSKLPAAEAYNKFQLLSLEKTKGFLSKKQNELLAGGKNDAKKNELNIILSKLDSTLKSATDLSKGGNALKEYAEIMTDHVNKGGDGYMLMDSLDKTYKDSGYKAGLFNSKKVYQSFQEDLAGNILTPEQQNALEVIGKETRKESPDTAAGALASGISQSGAKMEKVGSRQTAQEIFDKKFKQAA